MDAQHQEIPPHSLENMMVCPKAQERKPRPQPEQALKCPRCDSTNTKFCYYNNYSLSQPRYFCKSCRRYWTQGGTLRNVPVGGGCRKNKRSSSSSSSSSSPSLSKIRPQDHQPMTTTLPALSYDHQANDLSLAFARLQKYSCGQQQQQQLGFNDYDFSLLGNPNSSNFLDGMRNGYDSHSFYYGNMGNGDHNNNNNMGGIENSGNGNNVGEMRLPYDQEQYSNATTTAVTVTTMKQELFGGRENENRILWGYPNWQMNGDGNVGDFDSAGGRESWNGINASSWHGLLNSPLM